jgi:hypothetical protein
VCDDIQKRKALGVAKYGTALQIENGRKALQDAYEEALDLAQYLKQEIGERGRDALYLEAFLMLRCIHEDWLKTGHVPPDLMEGVDQVFAPRAGWLTRAQAAERMNKEDGAQ